MRDWAVLGNVVQVSNTFLYLTFESHKYNFQLKVNFAQIRLWHNIMGLHALLKLFLRFLGETLKNEEKTCRCVSKGNV